MKIVFDTNFFDSQKYDWKNRKCVKLLQLHAAGLIEVFLPEIIDREIKSHLKKIATDTFKAIKKTLDQTPVVSNVISVGPARQKFLGRQEKNGLIEEVVSEYEDFKQALGVTVIPIDCSKCVDVFDDYFSKKPPFENSEDKKSEFPDAFAIESIKSFFDDKYTAVANDKGWRGAFEDTPNCTFHYESRDLFSEFEKLEIEEARRSHAHEVITEYFYVLQELVEREFPNKGFMATDVIDDYVENVAVDSVDLQDVYVEEADDDYIMFIAEFFVQYTATLDYTDPDSWSNLGDGDIVYRDKIHGAEVPCEIQFSGTFTYQLDPETGQFEDMIDWNLDVDDTVYFEVNPYDYY